MKHWVEVEYTCTFVSSFWVEHEDKVIKIELTPKKSEENS